LGGGTNVIFDDRGFPGLVVRLKGGEFEALIEIPGDQDPVRIPTDPVRISANPGRIPTDPVRLSFGAGLPLASLVKHAAGLGLTGIEDLSGIPGTIGGAVSMNAGAGVHTIGAVLEEARVMDPLSGTVKAVKRDGLEFWYRGFRVKEWDQVFSRPPIILGGTVSLEISDPEAVRARMDTRLAARKKSLPSGRSAGSFFKNPEGGHAGKIIDALGFKGRTKGGAIVSQKHANVIVNVGGATAKDILALAGTIERAAKTKLGITLEREVRVVGFAGIQQKYGLGQCTGQDLSCGQCLGKAGRR
jgi:UDP-N-acetylmuramate dehydrogenase